MSEYRIYTILEYKDKLFGLNLRDKSVYAEYVFSYFIKKKTNNLSLYFNNYVKINLIIDSDSYLEIKKYMSSLIFDDKLINIEIDYLNSNQINILMEIDINDFQNNLMVASMFDKLQILEIYNNFANKKQLYVALIELYYKTLDFDKIEILRKILIENKNMVNYDNYTKNIKKYTLCSELLISNMNIYDMF